MNDPLHQPPPPPVFGTSAQAGAAAARQAGSRYVRILEHLRDRGPSTLFEIAAAMELAEHQISGRFSELSHDGFIERTGQQRPKPETGCMADVWKLTDASPAFDANRRSDLNRMGYPDYIFIQGEPFKLVPPAAGETLPGISYLRNDNKGLFESWRLDLVRCPGCDQPLKFFQEGGPQKPKKFRCLTNGCNRTWELTTFNESGSTPVLALVMKHL